ncbi:MAG: glycosyltransferase [Minisyncoccia bacterium]
MFSSSMAMPYFARLITESKILRFILSIPSSYFSYLVALILGIFFIRLFFYFLWALKNWTHVEKINLDDIKKIGEATNQNLPTYTILIPALSEAEVIAPTILRVSQIHYPRSLYSITIIVDEKERLRAKEGEETTRGVVEKTILKLKDEMPDLKLNFLEVPYDFDGKINGQCLGYEVASTKGRALNYALTVLKETSDFFAFFDAEAGPNLDSFLGVTKAYLLDNTKQVFQLPVYQIRNFWSLSAFCKVAALGQCFSHQYVLPFIFLFMPFIGGTNVFIHKNLINQIDGFDNSILTEDIEIGVRIYTDLKKWPVYLPYPSTEQTPPAIKAYHQQRYRWGYGLMQTLRKLFLELKDKNSLPERKNRLKKMILSLTVHGPLDWVIYYPLSLAATVLFVLRLFKMFYSSFLLYHFAALSVVPWNPLNDLVSLIIVFIPLPTLIFLLILLKHYWSKIDFRGIQKKQTFVQLKNFILFIFFLAPIFASYYVFPYVHAFVDYLKNPQRKAVWVKTKRTKETQA